MPVPKNVALGRRASVSMRILTGSEARWRFDILARGASPEDVAKMLGDTIETVERHYMSFVRAAGTSQADSRNSCWVRETAANSARNPPTPGSSCAAAGLGSVDPCGGYRPLGLS